MINPLDRFRVSSSVDGARLAFDNAAIRLRLVHEPATCNVAWSAFDNTSGSTRDVVSHRAVRSPVLVIPVDALGPADAFGSRYAVAHIRTHHASFPEWQAPIAVTVRERRGTIDVVGIERPTGR